MSGRVLGVAVATVTGIAIAVSTFKPELEAARRRRLEDEYNREVAALNTSAPLDAREKAAAEPPEQDHSPNNTSEEKPSRISSLLGLWAWKRGPHSNTAPSKESPTSNDTNGSNR
ncbi:hypothetical protein K505DRAFT_323027 [Melanomma pulvis-pyrius CBS 109.77]|uniref:Uncharacterized protein n=1 Tax=Melanomma pulvis-pyrius CBS 109.77 TaxID=1314802 RepID=A0A6A6XKY7_9PLEO|nr:hypothetical protein K505DRAFT_323027 [Melanomma pulvis-pyrius CBS 109.77]